MVIAALQEVCSLSVGCRYFAFPVIIRAASHKTKQTLSSSFNATVKHQERTINHIKPNPADGTIYSTKKLLENFFKKIYNIYIYKILDKHV